MCGRYELNITPARIGKLFALKHSPEAIAARYNIAPTQQVPAVRLTKDGERELSMFRWGLLPHWAKDRSFGAKTINARAETVSTAPAFRDSFRRFRCLVPATGFYEWAPRTPAKVPYNIGLQEHEPFAFAGLWSRWYDAEDVPIDTCTIITTHPNELCAPFHNRMPVILDPADYGRWLNAEAPDAQELLKPYPADEMYAYAVSTRVNSVRNEGPELLTPVKKED